MMSQAFHLRWWWDLHPVVHGSRSLPQADCPLLFPRGWWHQQMAMSECSNPDRSIGTVRPNNPTRDGEIKTSSHSQDPLFLWYHCGIYWEAAHKILLPKSPSGAGVSEMVCILILHLSAQTSYTWLFLPAPWTSHPFAFRSPITSSHSLPFPFRLLLLILFLVKQWSQFSVNSVYAYPPLNPPPSFRTAFLQYPGKLIQETRICLSGL